MRKYLFRILVGLMAFGVGIGFVWCLQFSNKNQITCEINEIIPVTKPKSDIEVTFKKFVETEDVLSVDFMIVNNSKQPAFFWGLYDYKESVAFTQPKTKVNGKEINQWSCSNGLIQYYLRPGQSKTFRYDNLSYHWKKGKDIQIGFNFKTDGKEEFQTFWSGILPITDSIASKLIKEQKLSKF